jgi:hypothetical protein
MKPIVVRGGDCDEQREDSGRRHWWRDSSSGHVKINGGNSEDYGRWKRWGWWKWM